MKVNSNVSQIAFFVAKIDVLVISNIFGKYICIHIYILYMLNHTNILTYIHLEVCLSVLLAYFSFF